MTLHRFSALTFSSRQLYWNPVGKEPINTSPLNLIQERKRVHLSGDAEMKSLSRVRTQCGGDQLEERTLLSGSYVGNKNHGKQQSKQKTPKKSSPKHTPPKQQAPQQSAGFSFTQIGIASDING